MSWRRGSVKKFAGLSSAPSYLRVAEERGDARDVEAEAARGASGPVHTGREERVVLLPGGPPSRSDHHQHNPHAQAPRGEHGISSTHRTTLGVRSPPEKLRKLKLCTGAEPAARPALLLAGPGWSDTRRVSSR